MAELVTMTGFAHAEHDPPYQLDDGRSVPVLDRPDRVSALLSGARQAGSEIRRADPIDPIELRAVHDPGMVVFLETAFDRWLAEGLTPPLFPDSFGPPAGLRMHLADVSIRALAGYYCRDTCSPVVAGTWAAALDSAAIAVSAARLLVGGGRHAYALCRPPGHHAARGNFSGFCYLNNAALAANRLRELGRVAVVDLDFHHGNGTQDIFWSDPDVFYLSLHGFPGRHFPFFSGWPHERGGPGAEGTVLNKPLADRTTGAEYVAQLADGLTRVTEFGPSSIVVSLGLDMAATDPVGTFQLSDSDLEQAGRMIGELGQPAVAIQEGGYDLERLDRQICAFLTGFVAPRPSG
jgi:acetoin utilization deacetylase AcuC-like enzyme